MEIPLNGDVHCPDGRCGRSTYVIMNPTTEKLTHLVVREQWPSRTERLVPIGWVQVTTRDVIVLNRSREEFSRLDPFNQTDFVYTDVPHHATDPKLTLFWPYVVPAKRIVDQDIRRVSEGELVVRRGARVQATDGGVGHVDEFCVDADDGKITHLVLTEGNLLGLKEITIPLSYIERMEEGRVFLNVDKKTVRALPAIPVERRWRQ